MSEVDDLTNYYSSLLIKQYHTQPKARATIGALANEALANLAYFQARDAFDYPTAVGVQLDLLGKYVGALRHPDSTLELEDAELRFLIKMKAIKNSTDNSMKSIDDYLWQFFGAVVKAINNEDMTITYQFSTFFIDIMNFAEQTDSLPRPLSVGVILEALNNPNGDFGYSFNNGDNNGGLPIYNPQIWGNGFTPDDAPIVDEEQTSFSADVVDPTYAIISVSGVWLATDPGHTGTNYYTGGSFTEESITLGTLLPNPNTAVLINYTAHYGGTFLFING